MKKFILGIIFTLFLGSVSNYSWDHTEKETNPKLHEISRFVFFNIIQGEYFLNVLEGNCQDRMSKNGFGWKFNVADYYQCDRLQRLLNGNHKAYNPESDSKN